MDRIMRAPVNATLLEVREAGPHPALSRSTGRGCSLEGTNLYRAYSGNVSTRVRAKAKAAMTITVMPIRTQSGWEEKPATSVPTSAGVCGRFRRTASIDPAAADTAAAAQA